MKTISRLGDRMLGALLHKAKGSACSHCQYAYTGCGGSQCFFYYNRFVSGQWRCYANTQNLCNTTYVSYRAGCC
jgi:hypothetical protein